MGRHICQLTVQGRLGRIVVNTLHAVFLETTDVDQQLGNVVGALAVEAWHHVGNMRQLLWIKCAHAYLVVRGHCFGRFNA